jgi:glycosyltransferase involved in cell wall biosynthesis
MASGSPIVATRVNGAGAIEGAGLLVEPGDTAALAAALDRLLADRELQQAFGAEVRRRAVERFSLEAMVDRTASLWQEVAR